MKTLQLNNHDYDMLRQCVIAQIENIVGNMNPTHAQIELRKLEPLINQFVVQFVKLFMISQISKLVT